MHLPVRVLQAESEALMQAGASTETIGRASVSSDEVPAGKGLETTLGRLGPWATPRRSPREANPANRSSGKSVRAGAARAQLRSPDPGRSQGARSRSAGRTPASPDLAKGRQLLIYGPEKRQECLRFVGITGKTVTIDIEASRTY